MFKQFSKAVTLLLFLWNMFLFKSIFSLLKSDVPMKQLW